MCELGLDSKFVGFSNTRLAHDDLFARLCLYLEKGGTNARISDNEIYERYRKDDKFRNTTIESLEFALQTMTQTKSLLAENHLNIHITKASFFSWLLFSAQIYLNSHTSSNSNQQKQMLTRAFVLFETSRYNHKNNTKENSEWTNSDFPIEKLYPLFSLFNERASSRVMTTSSLLIRDWCISLFYYIENNSITAFGSNRKKEVDHIISALNNNYDDIKIVIENMAENGGHND